jgi:hypothetical protein
MGQIHETTWVDITWQRWLLFGMSSGSLQETLRARWATLILEAAALVPLAEGERESLEG